MDTKTIQTYNKYSKEYDDEVIEFWNNFPTTTIDAFCNRLKGNKVLNLGSGSGRDALILRNRGLNITCVDASSEMVKITRNLGFNTIETDFLNLKIEENCFDGIWEYTALLHLRKDEVIKILTTINSVLKPGGVFLTCMIEGTYEGEVERENMRGGKRYFRYYEEKEIREMVERAGFKFDFQERYKPHSKTFLAQIYVK